MRGCLFAIMALVCASTGMWWLTVNCWPLVLILVVLGALLRRS